MYHSQKTHQKSICGTSERRASTPPGTWSRSDLCRCKQWLPCRPDPKTSGYHNHHVVRQSKRHVPRNMYRHDCCSNFSSILAQITTIILAPPHRIGYVTSCPVGGRCTATLRPEALRRMAHSPVNQHVTTLQVCKTRKNFANSFAKMC